MDKEYIIIDGRKRYCKILFRCKHIDDTAAYDMMCNDIEITPENAPVGDSELMLIENTNNPFGFSFVCKRNSKEDVWEQNGFGNSGACSIVTALLKQLTCKTQECKKLNDKIIDMNSIIEDAAINLGNKDFTLYNLPFEIKKLRKECDIWKNQVLALDEEDVIVQVTQEQFEEYQKLKQECEQLKEDYAELEKECEKPSILAQEESARNGRIEYELNDKLKQKTQELYFARNEIHSKTEYIQEQRDIIDQLKQECEEQKTIISTLEQIIKYQEDKLHGYHELVLKMGDPRW